MSLSLSLPDITAWIDLAAFGLFAACACVGLAVLVRAACNDPDPAPVADPVADAWLRESLRGAGYDLLTVSRGHRLPAGTLGEFGFSSSGGGWVRRLRVRTWDGSTREGWLCVCTEPALEPSHRAGGDAKGRHAVDHLEITWDG